MSTRAKVLSWTDGDLEMPIDRIEPDDLKRYSSDLATSKKHGLGTLRNIVATLRAILSEAGVSVRGCLISTVVPQNRDRLSE